MSGGETKELEVRRRKKQALGNPLKKRFQVYLQSAEQNGERTGRSGSESAAAGYAREKWRFR